MQFSTKSQKTIEIQCMCCKPSWIRGKAELTFEKQQTVETFRPTCASLQYRVWPESGPFLFWCANIQNVKQENVSAVAPLTCRICCRNQGVVPKLKLCRIAKRPSAKGGFQTEKFYEFLHETCGTSSWVLLSGQAQSFDEQSKTCFHLRHIGISNHVVVWL